MMLKTTYRLLLAGIAFFAMWGCAKYEDASEFVDDSDANICFGFKDVLDSRISSTSDTFEAGDTLGVFAYYNYYYQANGESAALSNMPIIILDNSTATCDTGVKWEFSTSWSSSPRSNFDAVAYYPYSASDNIEFSADSLIYTYDPAHDFMIAQKRYSIYDGDYYDWGNGVYLYDNFRSYLQSRGSIPLTFYRQSSSITLSISKEDDNPGDITVTGAKFYLDASEKDVPTKLVYYPSDTYSGQSSRVSWQGSATADTDGLVEYAYDFTEKYSNEELTIGLDGSGSLSINIDSFFPPGIEVFKIILNISGEGTNGYSTHTWHPHFGELDVQENYTLHIQIDPGRSN